MTVPALVLKALLLEMLVALVMLHDGQKFSHVNVSKTKKKKVLEEKT